MLFSFPALALRASWPRLFILRQRQGKSELFLALLANKIVPRHGIYPSGPSVYRHYNKTSACFLTSCYKLLVKAARRLRQMVDAGDRAAAEQLASLGEQLFRGASIASDPSLPKGRKADRLTTLLRQIAAEAQKRSRGP